MNAGTKPPKKSGTIQRCPACGQRLAPPAPTRCPLCAFDFGDDRVTGADITPYAKTYARGLPGWLGMCEWVWFAGAERLKHLALARSSAASRRFARINALLLATSLGLIQGMHIGWRFVSSNPAAEPTGSIDPSGSGWFVVARAAGQLPVDTLPAALWWNPIQSGIGFLGSALVSLLLIWVTYALSLRGVHIALAKPYRNEGRMTAAFHYTTSWALFVGSAAVVTLVRPLAYVGDLANWRMVPTDRAVVLVAGLVACLGTAMWWFQLVRAGALAPQRTRARLAACVAIVPPLLAVGALLAVQWATRALVPVLFEALGIQF